MKFFNCTHYRRIHDHSRQRKITLIQTLQKLTVGLPTIIFIGSSISLWFNFIPSVLSVISFLIASITIELLTDLPLVVKAVLGMIVKNPETYFQIQYSEWDTYADEKRTALIDDLIKPTG